TSAAASSALVRLLCIATLVTPRWRKTDSNCRSLSGRIPLFCQLEGWKKPVQKSPRLKGGTGSSNPSSSSGESGANLSLAERATPAAKERRRRGLPRARRVREDELTPRVGAGSH